MSAAQNASLVRQAFDELLRMHPHLDVVAIEWQIGNPTRPLTHDGPWVLVTLGQPSESFDETPAWALWRFAIWKRTGAVYTIGHDGAVSDDPIWATLSLGEKRPA